MPKEDPFVNRAQLLKAIKKYPEIWDSNNKLHMCRSVTSPMWSEIAEQFGGNVPTVKLQSIWSQMKYHYHNLVHRQILHKDRFTTKWEHFEPMSFMYNITVSKILGAAANNGEGGQGSPPEQQQPPISETSSMTGVPPPPTPPPPQQPTASQGRGRPSGSFTWLPHALSQSPTPPPATPLPEHHQHQQHHHLEMERAPQPAPPQQHLYTAFTGLVPPAAITVETTTTPLRKLGRPSSLHNSMRGRIIDAIKARPPIWAGRQRDQRQGQNRTSAVWKECAAELGLTPTLVQTRWSIIKQRFVDELQKERHAQYSQQDFRSNWEHFERMSFMREILIKKVDEREQTREQIQEIVSEHHHQQQQQQQHQQQQQQQQQQPQQQHQPHQQLHHHHHLQVAPHLQHYVPLALAQPPPLSHHHRGLAEHAQDMPIGLVHHPPQPPHVAALHVGRRHRLKHESDLEWDPFEMIMHVHGANVGAGVGVGTAGNGEPTTN